VKSPAADRLPFSRPVTRRSFLDTLCRGGPAP